MKPHHILLSVCTTLLISTNSFAVLNCCNECKSYNATKYGSLELYHAPDCTATTPSNVNSPYNTYGGCVEKTITVTEDDDYELGIRHTETTYYAFNPAKHCGITNGKLKPWVENKTTTTHTCRPGSYTKPNGYCGTCPENATCAGGINSTWTCNTGYAKPANYNPDDEFMPHCMKCPANATCWAQDDIEYDTDVVKCNKSYYMSSSKTTCIRCPEPGMTGNLGATSPTSCFIYPITPGTSKYLWYDQTGYFNVTDYCGYSTTQSPKYPVLGLGIPK